MNQDLANFKEEQSAKIPALTLLNNLGYEFISPKECLVQRGSLSAVTLPSELRGILAKKTFSFMGKAHPLSPAAIDKIVQELSNPAMNEGLRAANEKLYNALTYGIGVTEFIEGKKANPTIQIIDWEHPENNVYHFTEGLDVENSQGAGKRIPDIVCFVNDKFGTAIKLPDCYNDSPDIIVLVDEGHRSQNGENNIRMQQTLPKAAYIAFTGTPLLQDDKTENKFGKIIHSYTMQQAVEDGTVTPLLYEERIPELSTNDKVIDAWFDRITVTVTLSLPCLAEQKKIASVLKTADKGISKLELKLQHLKQEKKALMQQLLTGKRRVKVEANSHEREQTNGG